MRIKLLMLAICLLGFSVAYSNPFSDNSLSYPYTVEFFSFKSQKQNLQMAYMDVQPKKPNGATVLLLHGKNFNGRYWEGTIAKLTAAGYRVVVPDQVGFGQSTQPGHYQYTFQQLANNTRGLLDYLKINKVLVIGHSMGGMLATRFALMYPERTIALVLEDPVGLEDWKRYIPYHGVDQIYKSELKLNTEQVMEAEKANYYHGTWKSRYGLWINTDLLNSPNYPLIAWNSALQTEMVFTQPVLYEFKDLKIPVLLIVGTLDRTVVGRDWGAPKEVVAQLGDYPRLGRQVVAMIPHAQLKLIPGVGHIPHIENPQAFYAVLLPYLSDMRRR
ncbi:MAG: alpha/beta hydrolase [Proteobacteria bacterium]|nr:alpha/beta hydrolase [Pseudomonadota bacterium]